MAECSGCGEGYEDKHVGLRCHYCGGPIVDTACECFGCGLGYDLDSAGKQCDDCGGPVMVRSEVWDGDFVMPVPR